MKMAAFLIWFSIALLQAETSQYPAPEAFGAFEDALMQTRAAVKAHWMVTLDTWRDAIASHQCEKNRSVRCWRSGARAFPALSDLACFASALRGRCNDCQGQLDESVNERNE